ncbi:hypothetical protein JHK85_019186 [Glycine max]|nr:hypothetical protein JHK85_019186 [Glycine max]
MVVLEGHNQYLLPISTVKTEVQRALPIVPYTNFCKKSVLEWEKKSGKAWVHSLPEVLSYRIHKRPWSIAALEWENHKNESENDAIMVPENRGLCLGATGLDAEYVEENSGTKEVCVQDAGAG